MCKSVCYDLFQASLGLSREYLINGAEDHDVNSYYNYMVRSVATRGVKNGEIREDFLVSVWLCSLARTEKQQRKN